MILDSLIDSLNSEMLYDLEDIYDIWSWHPGMG